MLVYVSLTLNEPFEVRYLQTFQSAGPFSDARYKSQRRRLSGTLGIVVYADCRRARPASCSSVP